MKAIIFAGGVGTRLWPLSRKSSPKQFEKVIGDKSTLQHAVTRLLPLFKWEDIYISTGESYTDLVKKQLPNIPSHQVIGEPEMRDVGPAVGLMTAILFKENPQSPITILWSDHLVRKEQLFRDLLNQAEKFISKNPNKIIFISQKPRFASQNLGWIEYGKETNKIGQYSLHQFKSFKYRPDLQIAEDYFKSGHHAWNLGYFVTTPSYLWSQYKLHCPKMYDSLKKIQQSWGTSNFSQVLKDQYPSLEKISFDNAILEKINPNDAFVSSENLEWSDVGAWEALKEALQKSEKENVTHGKVLVNDCEDSLIYNYGKQLVVGIDLKEVLIVNTQDVILVCHKHSVPKIKKLVESLAGTENDHLT